MSQEPGRLRRVPLNRWRCDGAVITLILIASLCLNIAQAQRLGALTAPTSGGPAAGTVIQPLRLTTATGTTRNLFDSADEAGLPTILYYFSASCVWCERNWANVAALERGTRRWYRFVAVSAAGGLEPTIRKPGFTVDLYTGLTESHRRALGLQGTPHTVVLSPEGRVLQAWAGAFNARVGRQVERYFGVVLPGLTAAPPRSTTP